MPRLIFSAVVGSQAFGLARIDSDVDVRGMYAATLEEMLDPLVSVVGPDCKRNDEHDAYHHEFTHFLKLLGIGLRNLHFVQSVVQGLPGFAFDLGNLREALVTLIDNWNVDEARLLYNEIIGRQVETTPRHDNAVIRRQALVEYYHYHCL